jgi:hypothetical protein
MSFRDPFPDAPAEDASAQVEELEAEIASLERLLAPFESALWATLEAQVQAELEAQVTIIAGVGSMGSEQLLVARGRLQALAWVVNLPNKIRDEMNRLLAALEEIQPAEGDEDDAG